MDQWAINLERNTNTVVPKAQHESNWFSENSSSLFQEVETEQYYTLFLETLKDRGYDGYFCPKSRAKLVSEQERKHVDGCAVFFKTEK